MKMNNVIVDVKGKGKYVFKVEERVILLSGEKKKYPLPSHKAELSPV